MEKTNIWIITPKTNLHVGDSNSSSYGLIDLAVQRDAVSGLPSINSSSLKGAINEWATQCKKMDSEKRIRIFGSDKQDRNAKTQKGGNLFFDAQIIALPVPDDRRMYRLITCQEVIDQFLEKARLFVHDINEDDLPLADAVKVDISVFKEKCSDDNLPIIARNTLENGVSTNLWYEQVVPAESRFATIIGRQDCQPDSLTDDLQNQIVQIGANGSIGYGYCQFTHL